MKLKIESPCHLSWNELEGKQCSAKKHCKECNRSIYDFRKSTEQEILNFINTQEESRLCGMLPEKKSNSTFLSAVQNKPNLKWFSLVLVLFSAVFSNCKNNKSSRQGNPGFIEVQDLSIDQEMQNTTSSLSHKSSD